MPRYVTKWEYNQLEILRKYFKPSTKPQHKVGFFLFRIQVRQCPNTSPSLPHSPQLEISEELLQMQTYDRLFQKVVTVHHCVPLGLYRTVPLPSCPVFQVCSSCMLGGRYVKHSCNLNRIVCSMQLVSYHFLSRCTLHNFISCYMKWDCVCWALDMYTAFNTSLAIL